LKNVYENYTELPQNISDRIYNLAQRITEGKESPYEKALAIEQYFHNSGYVYDLDPPRLPEALRQWIISFLKAKRFLYPLCVRHGDTCQGMRLAGKIF